MRGYFTLSFKELGNRTAVLHTEGFFSAVPCFAWLIGFIYFHIMARGGMAEELGRLKNLVEAGCNVREVRSREGGKRA